MSEGEGAVGEASGLQGSPGGKEEDKVKKSGTKQGKQKRKSKKSLKSGKAKKVKKGTGEGKRRQGRQE